MNGNTEPYILDETEDFSVVFKPPQMHSANLSHNSGGTLLDWYSQIFPPVKNLCGRKEGEGGLLHRLDFETRGLVLFAKNQKSLDHFLQQQAEGNFVKEYNAVCRTNTAEDSSFPPPPFDHADGFPQTPFFIESFFRPYGPGRKQVRPVIDAGRKVKEIAKDKGGFYRTEIVSVLNNGEVVITAKLRRGFRHQIRCHLAWTGFPVINDSLYNNRSPGGILGLCASGLIFTDPGGGRRKYHVREN